MGSGVAATLTGSSTLDAREGAREASDSEWDVGKGMLARTVRSSISSGLERGEGVQMSGSGLELDTEPAPPWKCLAGNFIEPMVSLGDHILLHLQQQAVLQHEKATCPQEEHDRWRATAGVNKR